MGVCQRMEFMVWTPLVASAVCCGFPPYSPHCCAGAIAAANIRPQNAAQIPKDLTLIMK